jgi:hypothetical protein
LLQNGGVGLDRGRSRLRDCTITRGGSKLVSLRDADLLQIDHCLHVAGVKIRRVRGLRHIIQDGQIDRLRNAGRQDDVLRLAELRVRLFQRVGAAENPLRKVLDCGRIGSQRSFLSQNSNEVVAGSLLLDGCDVGRVRRQQLAIFERVEDRSRAAPAASGGFRINTSRMLHR